MENNINKSVRVYSIIQCTLICMNYELRIGSNRTSGLPSLILLFRLNFSRLVLKPNWFKTSQSS